MMTAHSKIALAGLRVPRTGCEPILRTLHPRSTHVAVRSPIPLIETRPLFATRLASPPAFALIRPRFLIARRFGAMVLLATWTFFARRWILLSGKWPGGKRE